MQTDYRQPIGSESSRVFGDAALWRPRTFRGSRLDEPSVDLASLSGISAYATIALRAQVPIKVISERLGHESPAFTMKQYAHVIPGMQAEAAALTARLVRGD